MITEDYVSFETARLLKEKGFNEKVICYYDDGGSLNLNKFVEFQCCNQGYGSSVFAAPTLQMVCKWLRLKHNLFIEPMAGETDGKGWFDFDIIPFNGRAIDWDHYKNLPFIEVESPEEAIEIAIKYCLENLI